MVDYIFLTEKNEYIEVISKFEKKVLEIEYFNIGNEFIFRLDKYGKKAECFIPVNHLIRSITENGYFIIEIYDKVDKLPTRQELDFNLDEKKIITLALIFKIKKIPKLLYKTLIIDRFFFKKKRK